ncbi:hypothetical protein PROFUN_04805 [Planoprotostelium fungivorum]|uniref:Uncharacterized protein n=1 Tax=Planoprotostelium fungivorum TaxID=1890364 RepID=A0A2P6NSX7_9EUKA|nr:hypothetical protein PROFUN_04805 [Planoprotostelium fungivorum]
MLRSLSLRPILTRPPVPRARFATSHSGANTGKAPAGQKDAQPNHSPEANSHIKDEKNQTGPNPVSAAADQQMKQSSSKIGEPAKDAVEANTNNSNNVEGETLKPKLGNDRAAQGQNTTKWG